MSPSGPSHAVAAADKSLGGSAEQTRIAAFGDSLMWGQGLRREDRFTAVIATLLKVLLKKPAIIVYDRSRSGAKIASRGEDRALFPDTFPALFPAGKGLKPFLESTDERPASNLYGEVPATFPTVRAQIAMLDDTTGRSVDVALVDGGINDAEPEEIVNPQVETGKFIEKFDGAIREIGHVDVLDLLQRVRRKCPNAVIFYFGFFPILSYKSDTGKLRDFLEHEFGDPFGWWLNENVLDPLGEPFGFGKDVNHVIHEGIVRAMWLRSRWQYWTRRAVVDANRNDEIRGPGIIYVPSGMTEDNAIFTPTPFLHDDPIDPTTDAARSERVKHIPRLDQFSHMKELYDVLTLILNEQPGLQAQLHMSGAKELMTKFSETVDGPLRLLRAFDGFVATPDRRNLLTVLGHLGAEIARIQTALIASVSHPNELGARQYAENAVARFRRLREFRDAVATATPPAQQPQQAQLAPNPRAAALDNTLRRYGLRTQRALVADADHLDVDSLAVIVTTAKNSDRMFAPDVCLGVVTKRGTRRPVDHQYLLNFSYEIKGGLPTQSEFIEKLYSHFEPGAKNFFTIDTAGAIRLDEIVATFIVVGPHPRKDAKLMGRNWRPTSLQLEVNGQRVVDRNLSGSVFGPLAILDLNYPARMQNFVPSKVTPIQLAPAKPFTVARKVTGRSP
jgi:hypothetical protein